MRRSYRVYATLGAVEYLQLQWLAARYARSKGYLAKQYILNGIRGEGEADDAVKKGLQMVIDDYWWEIPF